MELFTSSTQPSAEQTAERVFTKAEIMSALSMVEMPITGDKDEADSSFFKLYNAGANQMAEAIIEGLSAEDVKKRKAEGMGRIMIQSLFNIAKSGLWRD